MEGAQELVSLTAREITIIVSLHWSEHDERHEGLAWKETQNKEQLHAIGVI